MTDARRGGRNNAVRAGRGRGTGRDRTGVHQPIAALVGVVFLIVGVLGFIPGVTTNTDAMEFAGHESGAELLGLFEVSILHNAVHLLYGVAGLLLSRKESAARAYLIGGGIVYLALAAYGWLIEHDTGANFVPVNDPDNWLHLGLGLGMIALGLIPDQNRGRDRDQRTAQDGPHRNPRDYPGGREMPEERTHGNARRGVTRSHGDSGRPGEDIPERTNEPRQGRGRGRDQG